MRKKYIGIIFAFVLVACAESPTAPPPGAVDTAVAKTFAAWTVGAPKSAATHAPTNKHTLTVANGNSSPAVVQPTSPPQQNNCDPSYPSVCLQMNAGDYDCAGGSGNGPNYVQGPIVVLPPDPFDLDRDGDGIGCER